MKNKYNFARNLPVCKFYYRGEHTHPIRRTVVRIPNSNRNVITGYELREGQTVRDFSEAPIKSYRKDQIATYGSYSRLKTSGKKKTDTTLETHPLEILVREGA